MVRKLKVYSVLSKIKIHKMEFFDLTTINYHKPRF